MLTHLIPSPSISKDTGSDLKTRQQLQERLKTENHAAPPLRSSLHLLLESAESPAAARKHLSRIEFVPEEENRGVDAGLFFVDGG